jgi:acyl-[acyl carrier protein]--UDP-N-acetylglucosamine O-acyltransferase
MSSKKYFVHESSVVDEGAEVGEGTKIWHFSHVMKDAKIGQKCILGQNVFVASGVIIGDNVKIQNNVSIYTGVEIEDDVFLGPSCVLTNITNPRGWRERDNRVRCGVRTLLLYWCRGPCFKECAGLCISDRCAGKAGWMDEQAWDKTTGA